jgi:hypothetical protein
MPEVLPVIRMVLPVVCMVLLEDEGRRKGSGGLDCAMRVRLHFSPAG